MNFGLVRKERIAKLENKIQRVTNALKTYPYTNPRDYLEDLTALESFQKELDVQQAYSQLEYAISFAENLIQKRVNELYN